MSAVAVEGGAVGVKCDGLRQWKGRGTKSAFLVSDSASRVRVRRTVAASHGKDG